MRRRAPTSASQHDVFFCPAVDLAAVGTGEFWGFDLRSSPELFFDCLTGWSEFCGGRTPHEKPFNDWSGFYLAGWSRCKKFHFLCEPINDTRLFDIVRRHFEFHTVANREADKAFAHFSRNVGEHEMFIRQRDAKHRAGKNGHDYPFHFDSFFKIHYI